MKKTVPDNLESSSDDTTSIVGVAIIAGALLGIALLPALLPGLVASILGPSPKVYWFLSRSSATVAFIILWASMALGISITNRLARIWPGGPLAFELHQFLSLLGVVLAAFHALILLGDQYAHYSLAQILLPFSNVSYKPVYVGLGQIAVYLWAIIAASFYVRKRIGRSAWRLVHFASYITFGMALVHGMLSGTDSGALAMQAMYCLAGSSLLLLLFYRILSIPQTQSRRGLPNS